MFTTTSKTVNLLMETNSLIKHITQLGDRYEYFDSTYSKQLLLSKVRKLKFDLYLQENGLCICDVEVYAVLIECMKQLIDECAVSFNTSKIYIRYCNHKHKYTPKEAYAGVAVELWDEGVQESFFYFLLSPYIGEFGTIEVGLSVKCNSLKGVVLLKNYKKVYEKIKGDIPITNLSPANLYLYVLLCKMYGVNLSKKCENYEIEYQALVDYASQVNMQFPDLNLELSDEGVFSWNKKVKLKQVVSDTKKIIKFPDLSCFLYEVR